MSTSIPYDIKQDLKIAKSEMPCGCRRKPLLFIYGLTAILIIYVFVSLFKTSRQSHHFGDKLYYTDFFDVNGTHDYEYTISGSDICKIGNNHKVFLMVVIETAPNHFKQRQGIRQTWGNWVKENQNMSLVFFLGKPNSTELEANIKKENEEYGDIVIENFIDSYNNLSIKTVGLLRWVFNYCAQAKYVLKSDDDMFMHIPNLVKHLMENNYKRTILGHLFHGAVPVQDSKSKWYTPVEDFPLDTYPDYTSGTAYVVSGDLIPDLYNMALQTKMFWLEDIYVTGICAKRIRANLVHSWAFTYEKRAVDGCAYKDAISGHENTVDDLKKIWRDIKYKKC